MYICFFEGISMGRRFDDAKEMGEAITEFLRKYPKRTVRTEAYL